MATRKRKPRTVTTRRRGTTSTRRVKPRRRRAAARGQRVANFSLFNIHFGGAGGGRGRRKRRMRGFWKGLLKTGREVGKRAPKAGCLNKPADPLAPGRWTGGTAKGPGRNSAVQPAKGPGRNSAVQPAGQLDRDPLDTSEAIETWTDRTGGVPGGTCPCGGIARHTTDCEVWR